MNAVTVPKNVLKAFIQLSNQKPRNTCLTYSSKLDNDLLLVDVSGKRVTLTHTNRLWFVQLTAYDYEVGSADGHWCLSIPKLKDLNVVANNGGDVPLYLDSLVHVGVGADYLKSLNFDVLFYKQAKGKQRDDSGVYDTGLLQALTRFFNQTSRLVELRFPAKEFEPLRMIGNDAGVSALLMPVRR